jgi:iron complex transport system substrate-binding protein
MTAVTSGQVFVMVEDPVITRPGPRIVDGLEALARAIHPDLFE